MENPQLLAFTVHLVNMLVSCMRRIFGVGVERGLFHGKGRM